MDNSLKKTIREEIEKYGRGKQKGSKSKDILPVNTSPANLKKKKKIKSKAPQTERMNHFWHFNDHNSGSKPDS